MIAAWSRFVSLILVDENMIEPITHVFREARIAEHLSPVEQEVVVIEHILSQLRFDISREQPLQLDTPGRTPRKSHAQDFFDREFGINATGIDREARPLCRKAIFCRRKAGLMPNQIHQIGGIFSIVDGKGGVDTDLVGVFAQQPSADTWNVPAQVSASVVIRPVLPTTCRVMRSTLLVISAAARR